MARCAQVACAAFVFLVAASIPARADPINIVSGSLVMNSPGGAVGPVDLTGTGGFRLTGGAGFYTGLGLFGQCEVPECSPGTRIQYNLDLSGSAGSLGGSWSIGGQEYPVNDALDTNSNAILHFDGSFIAPAMGSQAILSAPFSMTGNAYAINALGEYGAYYSLVGRGVGTVTLVPYNPEAGFPPSWTVESVRFDFAQPTPEPSALLLLGTCAVWMVRRRRPRESGAAE